VSSKAQRCSFRENYVSIAFEHNGAGVTDSFKSWKKTVAKTNAIVFKTCAFLPRDAL